MATASGSDAEIKALQPGVDLSVEQPDPEQMSLEVDGQAAFDWMWLTAHVPVVPVAGD